jgi:cellulose synthase operon protein C
MQGNPEANHAAIAAWVAGSLTPAQRQEFETHLASCADCQAELAATLKAQAAVKTDAAPQAAATKPARRIWVIVSGAALILAIGYALGWWVWGLANR